jgi:hypothetical protein
MNFPRITRAKKRKNGHAFNESRVINSEKIFYMNQEKQETSEVLMDAVVQKLEQQGQKVQTQEKKIGAIAETVSKIPDYSADLKQIKSGIADLKTAVTALQFPAEKIQEFSGKLTSVVELLRQPIENKVQHHHHVPQIIWVAAGLFIVLCLTCSGWYMTAAKLDQYREADTKYRYLYLKGDDTVHRTLFTLDSLYRSGYAMHDSVIEWEADLQKASELRQQLKEKVGEGSELQGQLEELEKQIKDRTK